MSESAATPRADQPPPPRPEKRLPKPAKSGRADSTPIAAEIGSTTPKEREERSAATTEPLIGVWFTNQAGWDRGIDHAVTGAVAEAQEGRTLCGRSLGRRFVFTGDSFNARENFSCKTCARIARAES